VKKVKTISYVIMVLTIMMMVRPTALFAQDDEPACATDVVVQLDDWLSKIAEKEYGDWTLYPLVVDATNAKAQTDGSYATIENPDLIEVGWKLCIPAADESMAAESMSDEVAMAGELTTDQLANATYSGIYDEPVTLTDGVYEGEPFVEGGAARPTVTLVPMTAFGDLNGDGVDDAAVLLSENSGGSGVFTYLAAVVNDNGQPVNAGTVMLGDRVQIKSMVIENEQIEIEMITQGPNDPMCCATLKVRQTYALQDGQLAETGAEEQGNVSLNDLMGTNWTLVDFNLDNDPVQGDTMITAAFADGNVSGSAGCNNYNAAVSSDGGQALTVGPAISTMMACEEPAMSQETKYLTALQGAMQWSYYLGNLAITYQTEDGNVGTLVYMPQ